MKAIRYLAGMFRFNDKAICEFDFHDYPDSVYKQPWHFYEMTCVRCGKRFYI